MKPEAAEGEVVARAEGLRRETPGLTFGEAVGRVLDDEPSLYSLYVKNEPAGRERTHEKPAAERATPWQSQAVVNPQAFAERVALDEARDRATAKGIPVSTALDQVLEEQPELYGEAVGEPTAKLTDEQYSELQRYRELS